MQPFRKPLIVAATAAALVGGAALAATNYAHHVDVRLPDGAIAQVDYDGNVAPRVVVQPAAAVPMTVAGPFMTIGFPGFGQMDRIFADMQRQEQAMLQQAAAMQQQIAAHPGTVLAAARQHPGVSFTYVSSTTSSNGCTQTVQWSSNGAASGATTAQPQVIRTSSGSCEKAVQQTPVHEASDLKPQSAAPAGKAV